MKQRPEEYARTPQQQKLLDALEFCEIHKGISKAELMEKMRDCLPAYFKKENQP